MPQCAFLTLDKPEGFFIDDELTYKPLRDLGWHIESVPWRRPAVRWSRYDAVIIRSPWDYVEAADEFLQVLGSIDRAGVPLFNGLDLVRWNLQKTYLRDLSTWGVPVIPTVWRDRLLPGELPHLLEEVGSAEVVIKPVVGANARGTYRIDERNLKEQADSVESYYSNRALMAQPFARAIVNEGELSLVYFNGALCHALLKTPKKHDFRVQEEHGGVLRAVPVDDTLRAAGERALHAIGEVPLYARADFVRANEGDEYWLMELELIEPSLYLRMDEHAPRRFARAIHERAVRKTS